MTGGSYEKDCEMGTLLGLNGSTVPKADLETGMRAAARAGFALYEPRVPALTDCADREAASEARQLLGQAMLSWLPLNALEDVFFLPEDELKKRADEVFALAAYFGVSRVIVVPGRKKDGPITHETAQKQLKQLIAGGRALGLTLLYELIGFPIHHFPTLEDAHKVARAAGLPLVLDTFHLAVSRTSPEAVAALPGNAIGHVHLSDALTEGKTPDRLTDDDRVLPGVGGLELTDFMMAVRQTGYKGPVSVEVFHPKYGDQDPDQVAKDVHKRAARILEAAGWPL